MLGRKISRFVIDEAHCFSAWGHDFRVDYMYIAEFIRSLCEKKNLQEMIPVSCFTATAKPNVIEDIKAYSDVGDSNYIVKQLRHKDVYLSYFYKVREMVEKIKSGDELTADNEGCIDSSGNRILYFSRYFKEELQQYIKKGYNPKSAKVDYILYWNEEDGEEVPVIFPVLELERHFQP